MKRWQSLTWETRRDCFFKQHRHGRPHRAAPSGSLFFEVSHTHDFSTHQKKKRPHKLRKRGPFGGPSFELGTRTSQRPHSDPKSGSQRGPFRVLEGAHRARTCQPSYTRCCLCCVFVLVSLVCFLPGDNLLRHSFLKLEHWHIDNLRHDAVYHDLRHATRRQSAPHSESLAHRRSFPRTLPPALPRQPRFSCDLCCDEQQLPTTNKCWQTLRQTFFSCVLLSSMFMCFSFLPKKSGATKKKGTLPGSQFSKLGSCAPIPSQKGSIRPPKEGPQGNLGVGRGRRTSHRRRMEQIHTAQRRTERSLPSIQARIHHRQQAFHRLVTVHPEQRQDQRPKRV